MGILIPIIIGGAIAAGAAFSKKKGSSASSEMPDGIDEETLFPDSQTAPVEEPKRDPLIQPTQSTYKPSSTSASTAASSTTKPASTAPASKIQTPGSTSVKLPFPTYPRVLFLKTKVGSFSATALITKMQQAITSKNMIDMAAAYKEFMMLNNDQVRYFHNKYFEQFKVTPYAGWRTIKLSTGQQMIGYLLNKLIGAGVGEVPKEKI